MTTRSPDPSSTGFAGALRVLCDISATVGVAILLCVAVTTVVSVIGRAFFSSPIQGDVELVQLGGAICVGCFLPYTQFRGANIIVDFFTQHVRPRTRSTLDAMGTSLYTIVLAMVCWRVAAGGLTALEYGETSMLMGVPIWMPYFGMLPGLALATLVGAWQTLQLLRQETVEVAP